MPVRVVMLASRTFVACLFAGLLAASGCTRGSARGQTVSVLGFSPDTAESLRRDVLADFTRDTGLAVDLIPTWGASAEQLDQTLRLLKRHAATPDVYVVDVIWPGTLGKYLLNLSSYENQEQHGQLPALLANDTVDGRLVSLPFYVNVGMLYYRTDLLSRYGYDHPPATWQALEQMAAKIQQGERAAGDRAFWGYVWQGGAYEGLTCNALEWQASFGGGHIIESDGAVSVNNPRTLEALRMAAGWIGAISPPSVLSYTESDSLNAFREGHAAFLRHWSGGLPPGGGTGFPASGHYTAALLPAGPAGRAQTMGGFHLAVSRYSSHAAEAARLVLYLTGSAVQLRRALVRGVLPSIPRLYEDPALVRSLPYASLLQAAGPSAWVARPSTVAGSRYGDVSRAYYQAVHAILGRQVSAPAALADLEQRLVVLTGKHAGAPSE